MTHIEYTEENIDTIIDIINKAHTKLNNTLNALSVNDIDRNYKLYVKKNNTTLFKLITYFKFLFNIPDNIPKTYDDFVDEMYESGVKYYSQGRLERINVLNEMVLSAKLSKAKITVSYDDHMFLLSFI